MSENAHESKVEMVISTVPKPVFPSVFLTFYCMGRFYRTRQWGMFYCVTFCRESVFCVAKKFFNFKNFLLFRLFFLLTFNSVRSWVMYIP